VEKLTDTLCGQSRPGHFKGVSTIVTKLFNIVKPDVAYFGQKDAQQALMIKKMAADLNMDVDVKIMPIVREKDGLAMSSRNVYLSDAERKDALVLNQSLKQAESMIKQGERDARKIVRMIEDTIRQKGTANIDYVRLVDTKELKDMKAVSGEALIALAVNFGKTRLIDNTVVTVK
jgi:pantoate--beta-alanine ligase